MATSLAAQIQNLGKASLDGALDNRQRSRASILFDARTAAEYDLDMIYDLATNGFATACEAEPALESLEDGLFDEASRKTDRVLLTKQQNKALDERIQQFLRLGAKLLLTPSFGKCIEWLVRRFSIHEMNVDDLIMLALPYHGANIFMRIIHIIPLSKHPRWQFLQPFQKSVNAPDKSVFVKALLRNRAAHTFICDHVWECVQQSTVHSSLLSFYVSINSMYISQLGDKLNDTALNFLLPYILKGVKYKANMDYQISNAVIIVSLVMSNTLSEAAASTMVTSVSLGMNKKNCAVLLKCIFCICGSQPINEINFNTLRALFSVKGLVARLAEYATHPYANRFLHFLLRDAIRHRFGIPSIHEILSQVPLTSAVVETTCNALVTSMASLDSDKISEWSELLVAVHQRYPEQLNTILNTAGSSVTNKLAPVLSGSMHGSLYQTMDFTPSTLVLSLEHADSAIRAAGAKHLIKLLKSNEYVADDKTSVLDLLSRKLADDDASVVEAVLEHPEVLRDHVSYSVLLELLSDKLITTSKSTVVSRRLMKFHIQQVMPNLAGDSKTEGLRIILANILPSRKNRRMVMAMAEQMQSSPPSELFQGIEGAATIFLKDLEAEDSTKTSRAASAMTTWIESIIPLIASRIQVSNDYDSIVDLLFRLLPDATTRAISLLLLNAMTALSSSTHQLQLGRRLVEQISLDRKAASDVSSPSSDGVPDQQVLLSIINKSESEEAASRLKASTLLNLLKHVKRPAGSLHWLAGDEHAWGADTQQYARFLQFTFALIISLDIGPTYQSALQLTFEKHVGDDTLPFLAYVWTRTDENQSVRSRMAALNIARVFIKTYFSFQTGTLVDFQLLLPSLLVSLNHPQREVRLAGVACLEEVEKVYQQGLANNVDAQVYKFDTIYGGSTDRSLQYLESQDAYEFTKVLLSVREDILADPDFVRRLLSRVLTPDATDSSSQEDFKHSASCCLLSHVISTLDICLQKGLLDLMSLTNVAPKLLMLAPLLKEYASKLADSSWVDLPPVQRNVLTALIHNYNAQGIADASSDSREGEVSEPLIEIINKSSASGSTGAKLRLMVLERLQLGIFDSLKSTDQEHFMQALVDLAIGDTEGVTDGIRFALDKSTLSSNAILPILLEILDALAEKQPSAKKRAKTETAADDDRDIFARLVFILETLQRKHNSAGFDALASVIFDILARLIDSTKASSAVSLEYTKQVLLSTLTMMVSDMQDARYIKTMRIDTVVQCIRTSNNPQTHNQALVLISSLARLLPDQVLHNVMPIFTFMGSSIMKKDDQYTVNVIEMTIKSVIPQLILAQRLKTPDADIVMELKEVLTVFVDALTHVPRHRRLSFLMTLTRTLGEASFVHAVTELVLGKQVEQQYQGKVSEAKGLADLALDMLSRFIAEDQLIAMQKLLQSAAAIPLLADEADEQSSIFSSKGHTDGEMQQFKLTCIVFAGRVMEQKAFARSLNSADSATQQLLASMVATAFEISEHLQETGSPNARSKVPTAATMKACLSVANRILDLMSPAAYTETFISLVQKADASTRVRILGTLERQTRRLPEHASKEQRTSFVAIVPILLQMLQDSQSAVFSSKVLDSLTTVAEKLASKNPEPFIAGVPTILSTHGIEHEDTAVQIQALICLGILCRQLGPRIIRFLPQAVPLVVARYDNAVQGLSSDENAAIESVLVGCMGVYSALVKHLPSFISPYMAGIVNGLLQATVVEFGPGTEVNRVWTTLTEDLTTHVPIKVVCEALSKSWSSSIQQSSKSIKAAFGIARSVCEKLKLKDAPAAHTVVFDFFTVAFDVANVRSDLDVGELDDVEGHAVDAFIALVMKLNETSFKPLFLRLVDWSQEQPSRKVFLYKLMIGLFTSLKSLMTSYYGYVLDDAIKYLKSTPKAKEIDGRLWSAVMASLKSSFENDQEGYWDADRFDSIVGALIDQIPLAATVLTQQQLDQVLVPTFTQLAVTANNDALWRTLNTQVLLQTRSEHTIVRLTALRIVSEWYDRLGSEFVALLPETIPFIHELMEDDEIEVEKLTQEVVGKIEYHFGDSIQNYLS